MEDVDPKTIYFFLCLHDNKYYTLFISTLLMDLVQAFKQMDDEGGNGRACIRINVGSNTFISIVDRPMFLVEFDKEEIFDYAGDDGELDLFPDLEEPPEIEGFPSPVVDFPSYFTKDIEPYLDFKLGQKLYKNEDGIWVPTDI